MDSTSLLSNLQALQELLGLFFWCSSRFHKALMCVWGQTCRVHAGMARVHGLIKAKGGHTKHLVYSKMMEILVFVPISL